MSQAVSNTSPLTNLAVIGRLGLVREQLAEISIPTAVWSEMLALPHAAGRAALIKARDDGWLRIQQVANTALIESLRLSALDAGESEAIALAVELSSPLLLIDEKKGRAAARRLGLTLTGALGIVAAARVAGSIPSAAALIALLRSEAGFFVSAEAELHALRLAGER
jgi:hypothetical protein